MNSIYHDIAKRTNGDIYIGVVGPVRTGKSTFIKRFMDLLVLPQMKDLSQRERTRDELPQSAAGRTIMTTEPKFVPNEAVPIALPEGGVANVRLIDCVGYVIDGAIGTYEEDHPRMVKTPWFADEIPFERAAEMGTDKVIAEHSTIGLLITTDGSITDFPRSAYEEAEEKTIQTLLKINKPFIILINSTEPCSEHCRALTRELQAKYGVGAVSANCATLEAEDITQILTDVLYEFPITEIGINMPGWVDALPPEHYLKKSLFDSIRNQIGKINKIKETASLCTALEENEYITSVPVSQMTLGDGTVLLSMLIDQSLFYKIISESTGFNLSCDEDLLRELCELSKIKKEYDRIKYALLSVRETGYGVVTPSLDELTLEEPEIIRHGNKYGVKLKASAPSIHMLRADIDATVSPLVGSELQSEELVNYLLQDFENDPKKIWESNIFGKSLHELVNESLSGKLAHMPQDARYKLRETLERIINEGSGGLICIIL